MASTTALPDSPYAPLRLPAFRRYLLGLLALTFATQLQGVVVGWQIYALTEDPLALGLIGLAEALPYIGFALWAGHVADRVDRRRLVLAATAVLVACSIALLALAWRPLPAGAAGGARVAHLRGDRGQRRGAQLPHAGAHRVQRRAGAAPAPAEQRDVAQCDVADGGRARARGRRAALRLGGARTAYAVDVTLLGVALVAFVSITHRSPAREAAAGPVARALTEGVRYLRGQPVLLGAMTLDLFSVLFGGATALLPIFADDILRVGPEGLGVLRAAPAAARCSSRSGSPTARRWRAPGGRCSPPSPPSAR
jgi:hypothetical protein